MNSSVQTFLSQTSVVVIGAMLSASMFYWALMSAALPDASIGTMLDINGARYLSAFLVGVIGAHIAVLLAPISFATRQSVMKLESWLLLGIATVMVTLAIYVHFGLLWAISGLAVMALVSLLASRPGLPKFISNGITGFTWGVVIGAMLYIYMSSSNPLSLTHFLTGNFSQLGLWQPIGLSLCFVLFIAGHQQLLNRSGLSTSQIAVVLMLLMVAFIGIIPFIVSIALMSQQLVERINKAWGLLNYFIVGSLCLFIEALSTSLLAGNSLPFGLTLAAIFIPIIMWLLAGEEGGWRFALNIIAILITAAALWLVLLLNYANFIGQIV